MQCPDECGEGSDIDVVLPFADVGMETYPTELLKGIVYHYACL